MVGLPSHFLGVEPGHRAMQMPPMDVPTAAQRWERVGPVPEAPAVAVSALLRTSASNRPPTPTFEPQAAVLRASQQL